MKDQGRVKAQVPTETVRSTETVRGLLLSLAAQRSRTLWEGLEGARQVIKREMLGSLVVGGRVSHALAGASTAILIEKMAAAGPLGVGFRAILSNSVKFFWLGSLPRKE